MIQKVMQTIEEHDLIKRGDGIVVGVSGGADSMCLLHCLQKLVKSFDVKLYVIHIHHGLRALAADEDEAFVASYCKLHAIEFTSEHVDVSGYAKANGLSLEESGRVLRYRHFELLRKRMKADKIAVAHHQNDLVETYLLNMIRGTGIDGLAAIDYKRGDYIIRPLLDVTRGEIEAYCKQEGVSYCIDETNAQNDYTRNRIRNELIPYLKANFNPSIENTIARSSSLFKDEKKFWQRHIASIYENSVKTENGLIWIQMDDFNALSLAEKRHLIRKMILEARGHIKNVSNDCVDRILHLERTGTMVEIDSEYAWHQTYDAYVVKGIFNEPIKPKISVDFLDIEAYRTHVPQNDEIAVDASKIVGKLYLRHRKPGDIFSPIGMTGSKKLKKYFIDAKIPQYLRDHIWLLCDEEKIIWILEDRMSETCKITKNTKNVMLIGIEGSL